MVVLFGLPGVFPVQPGIRGDVEFAADDGMYRRAALERVVVVAQTRVEEFQGAEHIAVIRKGQMLHPQGRGLGRQGFHRRGAVQEGIIGMDVEMCKVNHSIIVPSPVDLSKGRAWSAAGTLRVLP